ncbi:hypothetical protein [Roseibium sp.]|uniref:hypothetical protein n=1 Tax=Roseibium sp. TaxID=1936156 RepID=UPI003A978FBE
MKSDLQIPRLFRQIISQQATSIQTNIERKLVVPPLVPPLTAFRHPGIRDMTYGDIDHLSEKEIILRRLAARRARRRQRLLLRGGLRSFRRFKRVVLRRLKRRFACRRDLKAAHTH